jgi:hypothetical protein
VIPTRFRLDRPHNAPIRISAAQRELSPGLALALALAARLWIAACRSERNWTLFVSCRFRIVSCGVVSFRSRKVSRHPTKQCMLNRPGMFWTWPGWLCLSLSLVLPGRHPPPAGTTPAHPSPPLLRRVGPDRSDRDSMDWIPGVLNFSEKPRSHNFHPPRFFRLAVDGTLIRRQVVRRNRYHRCGTRRTSGSGSVSADRRGIGYLSSAPCIVTASTMSRERGMEERTCRACRDGPWSGGVELISTNDFRYHPLQRTLHARRIYIYGVSPHGTAPSRKDNVPYSYHSVRTDSPESNTHPYHYPG